MSEAIVPVNARHVAIIMDGNGRWARARNMNRTKGHQKGLESVRRSIEAAIELKIEYLTLFGFSSENWNRPQDEVSELMRLLRYYLRSETADLHKSGIRLRVIGDRARFAPDIVEMIENAERLTADNSKLNLIIALNYGGRQDILQASKQLADHAWRQNHQLTMEEVEALLPQFLYTAGIPDPDLMIRTSGEKRISNFLIWSCAYTEFVFTDVLWPDFQKADLEAALHEYSGRDRRFGALKDSESK
ncbi:MAG: di-trans,poly-cis-decaprenylcistransferase [Micavibrio aeruginosavorus]|uniref:Isoprenyl transferase n=1 Tax=Micavibrio aeruginosavorus TaxID=349221 RepID=A0A2W5FK32_9BACT|nr:MAG: di-trans,poly-cis-decaprenylcistransferase [Micavibrio aeruginosavorus]